MSIIVSVAATIRSTLSRWFAASRVGTNPLKPSSTSVGAPPPGLDNHAAGSSATVLKEAGSSGLFRDAAEPPTLQSPADQVPAAGTSPAANEPVSTPPSTLFEAQAAGATPAQALTALEQNQQPPKPPRGSSGPTDAKPPSRAEPKLPTERRTDLALIRAWARANGYTVADRGRIAATVVAAYDRAH